MGGGKDQKQANQMINQNAQQEVQRGNRFDARNQEDLTASRAKGDDLYNQMKAGYTSLLTPAQAAISPGGGGGGGGGGSFNPSASGDPRFKEVENQYRDFSTTGGWSPERTASMQGNINAFKDISRTGGVDEEGKNRMRGNGVFDEFQRTGGYSEGDKANIRSRATSVIPAMYSRLRDEAGRMSSVQGGYGPGKVAMMSRLARQNASGLSDASRDAELGIMDKVNQGRQWGTEGMSNAEGNLQGLMSRNKLTSLTGAADTEMGMVNSINQGKMYGTSGIGGLAENDRQAAAQAAALAQSAGAQSAAQDRWAQEFQLRQKMAGLEGLGSIYDSGGPGEYQANKQFDLSNRNNNSGIVGDMATRQKSGNRSAWDTVGGFAGGALGAWA